MPQDAGPAEAVLGGVLGDPFPGHHALAHAADGFENQHRISRCGPILQGRQFLDPTLEGVAAEIGWLRIKDGGHRYIGGWRTLGDDGCQLPSRSLTENVTKPCQRLDNFSPEVIDRPEFGVYSVLLCDRDECTQFIGRSRLRINGAARHRMILMHDKHADREPALLRAAELELCQ
jgi:hypothetical protein